MHQLQIIIMFDCGKIEPENLCRYIFYNDLVINIKHSYDGFISNVIWFEVLAESRLRASYPQLWFYSYY